MIHEPSRRYLTVLAVLLLSFGLGFAQSDGKYLEDELVASNALIEAAMAEGRLTVYTANLQHEALGMADAFEARFPGIQVDVIRLPGGRLHERFTAEQVGNQCLADVIVQSDVALMEELFSQNLLAEHIPPSADEYPQPKRDGYWYVGASSVMLFAYNPQLVPEDEAPKSWADLLDPRWKGLIGWVAAPAGGTSWATAYFQRKVMGEEYWEALAAQDPVIFTGVSAVTQALIRGEVEIAYASVNGTYVPRVFQGAPVQIVYPPEGSVVVPRPIGVTACAPNPNAGRLYENWYLSLDGQNRLGTLRGTPSIRDGALPPPGMPAGEVNLFLPDVDELESLRVQWLEEWNQIFDYQ